jgi:hypothetical protein
LVGISGLNECVRVWNLGKLREQTPLGDGDGPAHQLPRGGGLRPISLDREGRPDELFHAALALPPEERDSFLARECAQEPELLARLQAMLRSHNTPAAADLDRPALSHLTEQLRSDPPEVVADLLATPAARPRPSPAALASTNCCANWVAAARGSSISPTNSAPTAR